MSQGMVWGFVAIMMALQLPGVILCWFAPPSFWDYLHDHHPYWLGFLWGLSHLFGPRLRPGDTRPWHRDRRKL